MLVIPAAAPLHRLCRITLTCSDRDDIPARVTATCARRCGVVVALTYARGRPDDAAELELSVEVDERHRALLVGRLAALVDVREVRCRDL
jgi:acetolactate synthase regulatory subunit